MNTKEGDMDMLLPGRSYNLFDDFFNNDFLNLNYFPCNNSIHQLSYHL